MWKNINVVFIVPLLLLGACVHRGEKIPADTLAGVWQAPDGTSLLLLQTRSYGFAPMNKSGRVEGSWEVDTDAEGHSVVRCLAGDSLLFGVKAKNNHPYALVRGGKIYKRSFAIDMAMKDETGFYQFHPFHAGFAMMCFNVPETKDKDPEKRVVLSLFTSNGAMFETISLNAIDATPSLDSIRGAKVYLSYPPYNEKFVWGLGVNKASYKLHYVLSTRINGEKYEQDIDANGHVSLKRNGVLIDGK
ncbi:MAG TPA: hypothetical protein VIQ97_06500 [Prevotella sp.]